MSSPHSASCHPHSVTARAENNHFIQSRSTSLFSSRGHEQGFGVSFQPNKNIKASKTPRKKRQRIVFLIALISFFLLPGNLFFFHFFPVQSQQLEALPKPSEAAPAPPATRLSWGSWCAVLQVQSLTWEAEAPSEREKEIYSRVITLSATTECSPVPSLPTSSHTGHHQPQMFFGHMKNQRQGAFLPSRHITFPAKLFNFPAPHPQSFPSRTFIPAAVICMVTHRFQLDSHSHRCTQTRFNSLSMN